MNGEWRTIESIPLNHEVLVGWYWPNGEWCYHVDEVDAAGEWMIGEGEATHWMPLPNPPPRRAGKSPPTASRPKTA